MVSEQFEPIRNTANNRRRMRGMKVAGFKAVDEMRKDGLRPDWLKKKKPK